MIGRLGTVVLETRDPLALAGFYSQLLGLPITREDDDWVEIGNDRELGFQLAPGHEPPLWPDSKSSMQYHFDIEVDDIEAAESVVLALGASKLPWSSAQEEEQGLREPGTGGFRVYTDPSGHPFCLCWD